MKQGDVLAQIDPRTYQAALDQATAKKAQDEAQLANARLDLARYTKLARKRGRLPPAAGHPARGQVAQLEAQVPPTRRRSTARARSLSYTTIARRSMGGSACGWWTRATSSVPGDATGMVMITQMQPIAVVFTLPQQELGRVLEAHGRGGGRCRSTGRLAADHPARRRAGGRVADLDNPVDPTTGTIKLKATFANEDGRLWPGAFVNVRLQVDTAAGCGAVPLVAVQRGPEGAYVFVV